jgi:hypothetical protein
MGCWKWFDNILKEAGIDGRLLTVKEKAEIDEIVHQYINEHASYGSCSPDWSEAGRKIQENEQIKQELIKKLRLLYLRWIRHKCF